MLCDLPAPESRTVRLPRLPCYPTIKLVHLSACALPAFFFFGCGFYSIFFSLTRRCALSVCSTRCPDTC